MEITLKNIGIVKNSTIAVNGLTVITGKNNSGKTTVGKTLYSLVDSVCNLNVKARGDRHRYILDCLEDVEETLHVFRVYKALYRHTVVNKNLVDALQNYPSIRRLVYGEYRKENSIDTMDKFLGELYRELQNFDVDSLVYGKSEQTHISVYLGQIDDKNDEKKEYTGFITEALGRACVKLERLFQALNRDPELFEFARQNISETLRVEFANQIQPVSIDSTESSILIVDNDSVCFDVKVKSNRVVNEQKPVYLTMPYKSAYFIDDPFVLDDEVRGRIIRNELDEEQSDCILNPNRISNHREKLKSVLRSKETATILEQTVREESLRTIKREIDNILPGTFEFLPDGEYYVHNGRKLRFTNLATGSKMFSILKLLLERGLINESTLLVLDEPEAHLHPSWQNHFAEIIVLLVKELHVDVLLTTHSSNFVLALDAYMRKHSINEKTSFYQTELLDDGMVEYVCVDNNIGSIYQDFLQYFSEVKVLRNYCIGEAGE